MDQQCGKIAKNANFIQKGEKVDYPWPWMGSLGYMNGNKWTHLCGASLVSQFHALTAAHCALYPTVLQKIVEGTLLVRLGNNNISSSDTEKTQKMNVQTMSVHPQYSSGFDHDLSILTFTTAVQMTDTTNTVCLPTEPSHREDLDGRGLVITGWGQPSENEGTLSGLIVKVYNNDICTLQYQNAPIFIKRKYLPRNFTDNIFCTGDFIGTFRGSTCHGDSGGPAISYEEQVNSTYLEPCYL